MKLTVAYLYPNDMNIYGDRGNIIALTKRLDWRGYEVEVKEINPGDKFDFRKADLVFGGGGQDRGQLIVGDDLLKRGENLRRAAEEGVPMLTVCGTYQLFGRGFTTLEGQEIQGINIFKAHTIGSTKRMIGNVEIESGFGRLVGFENHSGETFLEPDQAAIGTVIKGFGNNYDSGREGAVYKNTFGTYLHGPVLPKNPQLADYLIKKALEKKGIKDDLEAVDDSLELKAADVAASRPQ